MFLASVRAAGSTSFSCVTPELPVERPAKRIRPTLSRTDACTEPFSAALDLSGGSNTMGLCLDSAFSEGEARSFVMRALSNRCKTHRDFRTMAVLVGEFIKYAME